MQSKMNPLISELKSALINLKVSEGVEGLPKSWFTQGGFEQAGFKQAGFKQDSEVGNTMAKGNALAKAIVEVPTPESTLSLDELREKALVCRKCRLCEGRNKVVFGVGNIQKPLIAFVGEGPGADEDATGEPFVGRAGQLLTAAITKGLGLKREDVYIGNVVKCRPPENRAPLPDEVEACTPYLYRQLEIIQPQVIVTLGAPAQLALSGVQIGITKLRGQWQNWRGFKLLPTFHPAYLLRNPPAKKFFWEDLQTVMKEVGLPIQKGSSLG